MITVQPETFKWLVLWKDLVVLRDETRGRATKVDSNREILFSFSDITCYENHYTLLFTDVDPTQDPVNLITGYIDLSTDPGYWLLEIQGRYSPLNNFETLYSDYMFVVSNQEKYVYFDE